MTKFYLFSQDSVRLGNRTYRGAHIAVRKPNLPGVHMFLDFTIITLLFHGHVPISCVIM